MRTLILAALLAGQGSPARERLAEVLERTRDQYDPAEKMLRRPFSSPGYHTTLKGGTVHPPRDSLYYALALLDGGGEEDRRRAEEILNRVVSLQDQNPGSRTYGIWSWFLEEPLEKMSPPDWNWADFCGAALLEAVLSHGPRLSPETKARVDDAIRHAARSIQKRNVGPDYTNIAVKGTFVTFVAAERYGLEDLREYAVQRLRRLHAHITGQGAFTEFNSPTYTVVTLTMLDRLRLLARDEEARRLAGELYRMAWEEIAHHFHAPTRQWAGPHSRAYGTLLGTGVLRLIEHGTEGRVSFGAWKEVPSLYEMYSLRTPLSCPKDLEPCFTALAAPRTVAKTFVKKEPAVVGVTYLHPRFALGSVNRSDLWNQRRALVAYWGEAGKPSYLHLRFLHDGYDFSSAWFESAQQEGSVLAGISFLTNGGDRHVSLDRVKDGTIRAKDLRLRFEFGGEAGKRDLAAPADLGSPFVLESGGVTVEVWVPHAVFGEGKGRPECGRDGGKAWFDVVLHSGEERTVRLGDLQEAALGAAVRIAAGKAPAPPRVSARVREGRLEIEWGALRAAVPSRPFKR